MTLILPKIKPIEVDGKTIRYSVPTPPSCGRIEAERPAITDPTKTVFSEFIDSKVGYAIARKEGRQFEPSRTNPDIGRIH